MLTWHQSSTCPNTAAGQVVAGLTSCHACHVSHRHAADVQAYLNGVESPVFKNFFTVKTFVAKVIGSSLAVGSSLVMVSQCCTIPNLRVVLAAEQAER